MATTQTRDEQQTEQATLDVAKRRLRQAGVLKPYDDPHVLAACRDRGMTTAEIAREVCGGEVSAETVRMRLHKFGLAEPRSLAERLEQMDPEDVGLSPLGERAGQQDRRKVRA
ncbi:hypothetical protein ACFQGT_00245 [Natrialbaceae archaeon GCM10025810]